MSDILGAGCRDGRDHDPAMVVPRTFKPVQRAQRWQAAALAKLASSDPASLAPVQLVHDPLALLAAGAVPRLGGLRAGRALRHASGARRPGGGRIAMTELHMLTTRLADAPRSAHIRWLDLTAWLAATAQDDGALQLLASAGPDKAAPDQVLARAARRAVLLHRTGHDEQALAGAAEAWTLAQRERRLWLPVDLGGALLPALGERVAAAGRLDTPGAFHLQRARGPAFARRAAGFCAGAAANRFPRQRAVPVRPLPRRPA